MALIRSLVLTTPSTELFLFDSRESQLQDLVFTLYLIHLNSSFLIKKIFHPSNLMPNETRDCCSSQGILRTSLRLLQSSRLGRVYWNTSKGSSSFPLIHNSSPSTHRRISGKGSPWESCYPAGWAHSPFPADSTPRNEISSESSQSIRKSELHPWIFPWQWRWLYPSRILLGRWCLAHPFPAVLLPAVSRTWHNKNTKIPVELYFPSVTPGVGQLHFRKGFSIPMDGAWREADSNS